MTFSRQSSPRPLVASSFEPAEIGALLSQTTARVVAIEVDGRRVWVKRAVRGKFRPLHLLQRAASALIPLRILRYTGDVVGAAALDREVRIIGRLRERGARVPQVVGRGPDWIALEDLGPTLDQRLREAPDSSETRRLVGAAAWGLLRLHRRHGWHGNPQARNIVTEGDTVGFIDFEEDVGDRLGEAAAQTRDWALFVCSLQRSERRFPGLSAWLVRSIGGELPAHCKRDLLYFRLLATPLALTVRPFARWLGRDVRQALTLWNAAGEIEPQVRRRIRIAVRVGAAIATLLWIYGQQVD